MKKKFSTKWKASKQPRKKRKYKANAPLHIRHRLLGTNLSKELRKKYGRRSFPLRKNDIVKIMRGKFKGKRGKVLEVNLKKLKVTIEGIQIKKKDGTKVNIRLAPSNLQISELSLDDKKRIAKLENRGKIKENVKDTQKENKEKKENASQKK